MIRICEPYCWLKEKLNLRVSFWIDKLFLFSVTHILPEFKDSDTVLIFRLDNIGDYVLFRNFLPLIKNSPKYLNKKIVLIGNQSWASLSLKYDSQYFDEALFIDRNRFYKNIPYKVSFIRKVRQLKAAEAVNTVHSRTSFTDQLVRLSGAKRRITCEGDDVAIESRKGNSDRLYNKIIPSLPATYFEFYRNQFFFKTWLGSTIEIETTCFTCYSESKRENVIGIFPGATEKFRQWDVNNFTSLIALISKKFPDFDFYILGSEKEKYLSATIIATLPSIRDKIYDFCGKTQLPELVEKISKLKFLITNDSAGLHISIAANTPTICISNGKHFGRFTPYPDSFKYRHKFIYPLPCFYQNDLKETLTVTHQRGSDLDINAIKPEIVFSQFLEIKAKLNG